MIESDSAAQSSSMVMKAGVGKNGNVDDRIESTSTLSSVKHPSTKLIFYVLLCFQAHSARELLIIHVLVFAFLACLCPGEVIILMS